MLLDRNSPVPLYHQIEQAILGLIHQQELTRGSRLPSENELVSLFKVTRVTIRQATERLEQRGVIVRERGRGTFVVDPSAAQASLQTLTLILPDSHNPLHLSILAGAEQEARKYGFRVAASISENDPDLERYYIEMAVKTSEGLLLGPLCDESQKERLLWLQAQRYPWVLIDGYDDAVDSDRIVVDNFGGAYQVISHLVELGHKQIAFVYGPHKLVGSGTTLGRLEGYRQSLQEHGLQPNDNVIFQYPSQVNPIDHSRMKALAQQILHCSPPVTAVFCANDHLAQSFVISLQQIGVQVPEEFSVVGFDGLEYIPVQRRLTTVRRATREMGSEAVRLLVQRLHGDIDEPTRHIVLPIELILGETTAAPTPAP